MRKNLVINEDKYFIDKSKRTKKSIDINKIKKIPCLYFFLSISVINKKNSIQIWNIFIILIVNLYYIIELHKNQRQKDIEIVKKENILNNKISKLIEEKEQNNKYVNNKNQNLNFTNISDIDLNILSLIENGIKDLIELTIDEQKFFHGLLRTVKPKKIVEIGVSSGGSAILILNAIKDIEGAKLFSIDKSINWYRNGTLVGSETMGSMTSNSTLYLFNYHNSYQGYSFNGKMYFCRIWHNGEIVRDLVPCYRKSDNVIGFLDVVNNVFYANEGTGSFTKGGNLWRNQLK